MKEPVSMDKPTLLLSSTILRGSLMKCRNSARNKPFAPNNKTKALLLQRKPYCQNESGAIVLLCTQRGKWVHPSYTVFQWDSGEKKKMTEQSCKTANFRLHLPFCIRILQEQKGKDWNLVSKFQSFYVEWLKKWYNPRLSFCNSPFVLHWVHLGATWVQPGA